MMDIGDLAKETGVDANTIRSYEEAGLISSAGKPSGCLRMYEQGDAVTLRFIKKARELGFSIEDVRALLSLPGGTSVTCSEVTEIALENLEELDFRIDELRLIRNTLADTLRNCHGKLSADDLILSSDIDPSPLYRRFL